MGLFTYDPAAGGASWLDRLIAQFGSQQPAAGPQWSPAIDPSALDNPPVTTASAGTPGSAANLIPIGGYNGYMMPSFGGGNAPVAAAPSIGGYSPVATANVPQQPPQTINAQPTLPSFLQPDTSGGLGGAMRGAAANAGGGLLGLVGGAIAGGLGMGQGTPEQQRMRQTYSALVAAGVPEHKAALAVISPEAAKTIIADQFGPHNIQSLSSGYVYDPHSGKTVRAYEPDESKPKLQEMGTDPYTGQKQFGLFNPNDSTLTPVSPTGAQTGSNPAPVSSMGAFSAALQAGVAGPDLYQYLPPGMASTVKGMIEGRVPPPSTVAMRSPQVMAMINAASSIDPQFDATSWKSRAKMNTDIASSGPSSIGGIISNGKSAFEHLGTLSDKFADLGNYNGPDMIGGGAAAYVGNRVGNALGTSATQAKVTAARDAAGKYGAESTKFYAGTGGGVAERMEALHSTNPESTSGNDQAAFLETEKQLMLGRLQQKEAQIRDVMGDDFLKAHPVMTPELQATIDKIDRNILKLRGGAIAAAAQPVSPLKPGESTTVGGVKIERVN